MWRCGFFFFQAEDGIRDSSVTGVQTCALPIYGTLVLETPRGGEMRILQRDVQSLATLSHGMGARVGLPEGFFAGVAFVAPWTSAPAHPCAFPPGTSLGPTFATRPAGPAPIPGT